MDPRIHILTSPAILPIIVSHLDLESRANFALCSREIRNEIRRYMGLGIIENKLLCYVVNALSPGSSYLNYLSYWGGSFNHNNFITEKSPRQIMQSYLEIILPDTSPKEIAYNILHSRYREHSKICADLIKPRIASAKIEQIYEFTPMYYEHAELRHKVAMEIFNTDIEFLQRVFNIDQYWFLYPRIIEIINARADSNIHLLLGGCDSKQSISIYHWYKYHLLTGQKHPLLYLSAENFHRFLINAPIVCLRDMDFVYWFCNTFWNIPDEKPLYRNVMTYSITWLLMVSQINKLSEMLPDQTIVEYSGKYIWLPNTTGSLENANVEAVVKYFRFKYENPIYTLVNSFTLIGNSNNGITVANSNIKIINYMTIGEIEIFKRFLLQELQTRNAEVCYLPIELIADNRKIEAILSEPRIRPRTGIVNQELISRRGLIHFYTPAELFHLLYDLDISKHIAELTQSEITNIADYVLRNHNQLSIHGVIVFINNVMTTRLRKPLTALVAKLCRNKCSKTDCAKLLGSRHLIEYLPREVIIALIENLPKSNCYKLGQVITFEIDGVQITETLDTEDAVNFHNRMP